MKKHAEKRTYPQPEHQRLIEQRAAPAVFVLDEKLRVLHYREDPAERRKDCIFEPSTRRLPDLIHRTVEALLSNTESGTQTFTAVPSGSVLVRIVPLTGSNDQRYVVLVERFKMRASLRAVAARYALSNREHEALALLVRGARNSEIASRLQISPSTAIFHVKRLMAKTGARNRTELVAKVVG